MWHAGPDRTVRVVAAAAAVLLSTLLAAVVATAALGVVFARKVVVPPSSRRDDLRILRTDGLTVTLSPTVDSLTPGRYSLWFSRELGHARVGDIVRSDADSVVRRLISVDRGDLSTAVRGRLSGWFYLTPKDLAVPYQEVVVPTPLGAAPAWLVPASAGTSDDWAILVHGRAVTRPECLRAIPAFRAAGYTSLVISYRNDGEAPPSPDRRYALGGREWEDLEAAIDYALAHGAERIVLMGWSMGGATVLQTLTSARQLDRVRGVVLDSPVIDWITALQFQAVTKRLPRAVQWATLQMLARRWARPVTGQAQAIDFERLDFVRRAGELQVPVLLLHSIDDGYIPATASRRLARARPDIVRYEEFRVARHTRLWNYDEQRWTGAITQWLRQLSG